MTSTAQIKSLTHDPRTQALQTALKDELYIVGGAVREALLEHEAQDLDFTTPLAPDEIRSRLESAGLPVYPTALQHQTVTVKPVADLPHVELTTFHGPGMRPEGGVSKGKSIEEDLQFRDFTVNAIAVRAKDAEVIDPFNGGQDLADSLLRAVGDAEERFREDPLRMFRLIRFVGTHAFTVEDATRSACLKLKELIAPVAIERVRAEFAKLVCGSELKRAFYLLHETSFLERYLPEIERFVGFEQNEFHHLDLFDHTLEVMSNCPPTLRLRLAALLHDVAKPTTLTVDEEGKRHFYKHEIEGAEIAEDILKRLTFSHALASEVAVLVKTHMRPLNAGPPGLRRLLRDTDELYDDWRILREADAKATKQDSKELAAALQIFDERMIEVFKGPPVSPLKNLAVNGRDLLALGIPEGPQIGDILTSLHERVLDDPELNTKERLLNLVEEIRSSLDSSQSEQ